MESFFGTDGIRGVYGTTVTPRLFYAAGAALGSTRPQAKILIGKDPRPSAEVLQSAFLAGFFSQGGKAGALGVVPTPAVSYLTAHAGVDYGVVIGASHNPAQDNGIKLFGNDGRKLSAEQEREISERIKKEMRQKKVGKPGGFFRTTVAPYRKFLEEGVSLTGLTIALDTAFGSTTRFAAQAFRKRGATVYTANRAGENGAINYRSGATFPRFISDFTVKKQADLGFAFDGDGDRVIVSDRFGNIYDGDDLLYLFAMAKGYTRVVGTVLTNGGIERALKGNGVILFRSAVGDRNVAKLMRETVAPLGGEGAGHILFSNQPSGDGVYTALIFSELFRALGDRIFRKGEYCKLPSATANLPRVCCMETVQKLLREERELYPSVRLVVRPSGTESVLRLYAEGESGKDCSECISHLSSRILGRD